MEVAARLGRKGSLAIAVSALAILAAAPLWRVSAADAGIFDERVAPLLEAQCLRCHDGEERKGGLSLTSRADVLNGGRRGPALVPGDPGASLVLQVLSGGKPRMPKDAPPLGQSDIEALRGWIAAGAVWPESRTLAPSRAPAGEWWSLRPIEPPPPPATDSRWPRTPADAFLLARLEEIQLDPAPPADRRTLARRASFDLLGLPPAPAEIDEFLDDDSPDAFERLVDRLLASPRHGERWARHWLDAVHYGDTHGYDKDKPRPHAWPYRDYVVGALNADTPFVRFVEEQVAGDVLYPEEPDGVAATGFITAGPWDFVGQVELREGTVDKLITRSLDRDDMVATVMSAFTSLTVHCARCHDHKFDPVPQDDYYALQAVFAGLDRGDRPFDPDPEVHRSRRALEKEKAALETRLGELASALALLRSPRIDAIDARIAEVDIERSAASALPTHSTAASIGYHSAIMPSADTLKWVQVDLGASAAIDAVLLMPAHERYGGHPGPGFGFPPRFRVEAGDDPELRTAHTLADHSEADFPHPGDAPVLIETPGLRARYVRVSATRLWKRTDDWIFALGELIVLAGGANKAAGAPVAALDTIEAPPSWARANLVDGCAGRRTLPGADALVAAARSLRKLDLVRRDLALQRELAIDAVVDPALRGERESLPRRLATVHAELARLPPPQAVFAAVRIAGGKPREVAVLHRGDVKSPRGPAAPGTVACVAALEPRFGLPDAGDEGSRRAALARWIADRRNPLTWRSITNRVWQHHFGRGIVDTPNDFGRMGSLPTHPELLDWLAARLRDGGGSLKELHRLLVTSAAYRQSTAASPRARDVDASNQLLSRMSRRRLDAEEIRDAVLWSCGRLDLAMGGPAEQHFYFQDDHSPIYDYRRYDPSRPPSLRRSIYRFVVRSVPDPFMECLDCADPSILTARRNTTLTAAQALALLNNPFVIRHAESWAARLEAECPDLRQRVERVVMLALGRPPGGAEARELAALAEQHGLASLCRLVFNLNEFVFVD